MQRPTGTVVIILSVAIAFFLGGYYWKSFQMQETAVVPEGESDEMADSTCERDSLMVTIDRFPERYLRLYYVDIETNAPQTAYYILIPENLSVRSKLEVIASRLSQLYYGNAPIKVDSIAHQEGGEIAYVNMSEPSGETIGPWLGFHFQGSTGGYITIYVLKESFLQREYPGDWVDGVIFCYQGKPIKPGSWDHISLDGHFSRSEVSRKP